MHRETGLSKFLLGLMVITFSFFGWVGLKVIYLYPADAWLLLKFLVTLFVAICVFVIACKLIGHIVLWIWYRFNKPMSSTEFNQSY